MNINKDYELIDIDFGTGRITIKIEPGSVASVFDLVKSIKNAAMSVPLPELIKKIESCNGYPRF